MNKVINYLKFPFRFFKKLSRKKKIIFIIILVIIVFSVINAISSSNKKPSYTSVKATTGSITEEVTETGSVSSSNGLQVYSPTNGIVEDVFVENNETVIKGQELAVIKSSASIQEQQQALANHLQATSLLEAAKSNQNSLRADMYAKWKTFLDMSTSSTYEREKGIPNTESRTAAEFQIAQDEWVGAEAKYNDQTTAISQAQAGANATSIAYQATQNAKITATDDGVIKNLSISKGSTVNAVSPTVQSSPILYITSPTTTEITVSLNEIDATKVKSGQEAIVELAAVDNKEYKGVVRRIDEIGKNIENINSYNAYVEVLNPDHNFKSGMSSDVSIITKKINNTLTVPNSAVKPYKGGRAVRVWNEKTKKVEYKLIQIGVKGNDKTQVLSGLSKGDEIILALANEEIKRDSLF